MSNPCQNGGYCFEVADIPSFGCACPEKFKGSLCEIGKNRSRDDRNNCVIFLDLYVYVLDVIRRPDGQPNTNQVDIFLEPLNMTCLVIYNYLAIKSLALKFGYFTIT